MGPDTRGKREAVFGDEALDETVHRFSTPEIMNADQSS